MYTRYEEVNNLVEEISKSIQTVLGDKLVGLYLYGSAVWGDFDEGISDIDLLAAVSSDINDNELEELTKMHTNIVNDYPEWEDRIEVQYFSIEGLKNFRDKKTQMANISPGEPLHFIESGIDWLTNWYFVQSYGVTIFGPTPEKIIPLITKEEFIKTVKNDIKERHKNVKNTINSKPYQGYYIMTMCRGFYTVTFGEQVSKHKASKWVKEKYPEWSSLIDQAFIWRENFREQQEDPKASYPEVERFVDFMAEKVAESNNF